MRLGQMKHIAKAAAAGRRRPDYAGAKEIEAATAVVLRGGFADGEGADMTGGKGTGWDRRQRIEGDTSMIYQG
jgi:hypothetical protein